MGLQPSSTYNSAICPLDREKCLMSLEWNFVIANPYQTWVPLVGSDLGTFGRY